MQKIKLANKWNKETSAYDRDVYDFAETEGLLYGTATITTKSQDKFFSKNINFVVFKKNSSSETIATIKNSNGAVFYADFTLAVREWEGKITNKEKEFKIIINNAAPCTDDKPKAKKLVVKQEEDDEDMQIPF